MPALSPFKEALAKLRGRSPVGADLSSSQWRDVPLALRERAVFSARLTNLQIVQQLKDVVDSIIDPQQVRRADRVTPENPEGFVTVGEIVSARLKIKESLKAIGYNPGEKAGTIEDLSSDARINLQLTHNVESAQGFGSFIQGQAGGALTAFPAQELFRAEDRKEERAWATRWMQAGGQVFGGGRMIALKSDDIWERISAFGTPWPPFDFNSGMWVRDIDRDEAASLGLLRADEEVKPNVVRFNARLEASVENIDTDLQESLKRSFGSQIVISDGKARWAA